MTPDTTPDIAAFFHEPTNSVSYLVADPATGGAAVIDGVLDFDAAAGRLTTDAADRIVEAVRDRGLHLEWVLETHVHADHLSAGSYLKERLGGRLAIGAAVRNVQEIFATLLNTGASFIPDGRPFDRLLADNEPFRIGNLEVRVMNTPGHTPADITYLIGDAAFVGDTLFMPDYGTARCDFPGGDAGTLYRSIRRLLGLSPSTRLFLCHDYGPGGRPFAWETTVADQRAGNVHVHDGVTEEAFVAMRRARDATLALPKLLWPSVQVNMRGGELPPPEDNGRRYLKLPINTQ